MEFKYLEAYKIHPLIDHFYQLKISKEDLPFESLIVPLGHTNITYVYTDSYQEYNIKGNILHLKNLILTGQIYGHYYFKVSTISENLGFALKPTSLYKIINTDISNYSELHLSLKEVSIKISQEIEPIFLKYRNDHKKFMKAIYDYFKKLPLSKDSIVKKIDKAIDFITKKEGLISVNDLLNEISMSQKSLEIYFKRIIGITPGKYIKQHRFINLMRKYQSKEIDIKSLVYQYNYYDSSHFAKDFRLFIGKTPKEYFKNEYPLIKEYLKD